MQHMPNPVLLSEDASREVGHVQDHVGEPERSVCQLCDVLMRQNANYANERPLPIVCVHDLQLVVMECNHSLNVCHALERIYPSCGVGGNPLPWLAHEPAWL